MIAETALSEDAFLGGRLSIKQPRQGYRAGVDPVFLASAVPAQSGQSVLELGLGVGVASLCLAARVPGLIQYGIEVQPDYAALARANAQANNIKLEVVKGDIASMPAELKAISFDHVMMNPPYYLRKDGTAAQDLGRETSLGEGLPLQDWITAGAKRLKPGGLLTIIQRADRLPEAINASTSVGSISVRPLAPRQGRAATLVLLHVKKGGRAAFQLHAPLILHEGMRHEADGESYSPQVKSILREGGAFPL